MPTRKAIACLTVVVLLLGAYSAWLNREFYRHETPFFDSAAYTNYLAWIIGTTRHDGAREGWELTLNKGTAPLYGMETFALTALGVPLPSARQLAVWLQVVPLFGLAVSLYFYWTRARACGAWTAVALTLPFLMTAGVFLYNGGLQDFRLDLSLYLLLASAGCWYLQTYGTDSLWPWIWSGCFFALASLSRATAPVYAVVMFLPLLLVRLPKEPWKILRGVGILVAPFLLAGLPYFLHRYSYLYFYYVEFSKDANANLPARESIQHALFAWRSLGTYLGLAAAICGVSAGLKGRIDWKLLYLGCAPVLFLVWRGAGLNPFVAMPAVFGWLAFLLLPARGASPKPWALGLVLLACFYNAATARRIGPDPHVRPEAFRQAIDWMRADARAHHLAKVDFVTAHSWNFHPQFLRNMLLNDYGYLFTKRSMISPEGTPWTRENLYQAETFQYNYETPFTAAVPLVWQQQVMGANDAEKIEWLFSEARKQLDYIFLPDEPTITFMEKYIAHSYINTKTRAIRKWFLESGEWERIGEPLVVSELETVEMYAKKGR